jgi:DNA-binding NarL/FixJ family response regulator
MPELRAVFPECRCLVLGASGNRRHVVNALAAGASAVYPATTPLAEVVTGMRRLAAGESLIEHEQRQAMLREATALLEEEAAVRSGIARLTPREGELLRALALGMSDKEMAARWNLSAKTVTAHMTSIFHKLKVDSRLRAVLLALKYEMLDLE